jgi:hypothetical protein
LLEEFRISTLIEYWWAAAVAEEQHFTRAAKRLHIDQSVLSRHIQTLEASLGAKLFIRGERRFDLTEAAEAFIRFAKKALLAASAGAQMAQAEACGRDFDCHFAMQSRVRGGRLGAVNRSRLGSPQPGIAFGWISAAVPPGRAIQSAASALCSVLTSLPQQAPPQLVE